MTTAQQVKKLVQPLLERNPDLVLSGHWLFMRPASHLLRGILIDRTGQARRFNPRWAVEHLYEPNEIFGLNWGAQLSRPGGGLWDWGDEGNSSRIVEVVEREALPILRSLVTLDDFITRFDGPGPWWGPFSAHKLRHIPLEVARGNLELAKSICEPLTKQRAESWGVLKEDFERTVGKLCPLLFADDLPGLVRLLKEWQAYSVKQLKLEKVWEPSPFPLEQML